jgi:hypothetical protein
MWSDSFDRRLGASTASNAYPILVRKAKKEKKRKKRKNEKKRKREKRRKRIK